MGVVLVAITAVMHHGIIIKPGEEFSCDINHAKKLIESGSAKVVNGEVPKSNGTGQKNDKNREFSNKLTKEELTKKLEKMLRDNLILLAEKNQIELKKDELKPEIIKKLVDADVKLHEEDI